MTSSHWLVPTGSGLLLRVLHRALVSPPSLALLVAFATLMGSSVTWPFGLGALALEMSWLYLRCRSPDFVRAVTDEMLRENWQAQVARAEELRAILDTDTATTLTYIIEAQERLAKLEGMNSLVAPSRTEAASLMAHCLHLAEKRHQLQSYLNDARPAELRRELVALEAQAQRTSDPEARRLFRKALAHKTEELQSYRAVEDTVARIDGQLAAVRCAFAALVGKIVRLRAADTTESGTTDQAVAEDLSRLSANVQALEESLNETLALRRDR
ncbi:MAG: hypothetical protein HY320_06290 [Armatimonadetes bacterium]|nr:hypothetical protein [Armatimonadota bacterium]